MVFSTFPLRQIFFTKIILRWQKSLQVFFNFCYVFRLGSSGSSKEAAWISPICFYFNVVNLLQLFKNPHNPKCRFLHFCMLPLVCTNFRGPRFPKTSMVINVPVLQQGHFRNIVLMFASNLTACTLCCKACNFPRIQLLLRMS
jgi:hypothetical protein